MNNREIPDPQIIEFCRRCEPADLDSLIRKMHQLKDILQIANRQKNLTRITETNEFWSKHIVDSIAIIQFFPDIRKPGNKILDLGCGAGFPALVIATACPQCNVYAIDSSAKKIAFVKECAQILQLQKLSAIHARGRELARNSEFSGNFDFVTARAVANADKIWRETQGFLRENGKIILYKTPRQAREEIANSKHQWQQSDDFSLPIDGGQRCFIWKEKQQ